MPHSTLTISRPELIESGSDFRLRTLLYDLLAFGERLNAVRNGFGQILGMTGVHYSILVNLKTMELHDEDDAGVSRLAEHMHVSSAFITSEVNKLAAMGFVRKFPHPSDGRRIVLSLTDEARRHLDRLKPTQVPVNDALFAGLSKAEFLFLSELMNRLAKNSEAAVALLAQFVETHDQAEAR